MNPQDDVDDAMLSSIQEKSEAEPLLVKEALGPRGLRFLAAGVLLISGIIIGTYFATYLFPAWEQDDRLGWTVHSTHAASTFMAISESFGLFLAGPLGDLAPGMWLLGFEAVSVCLGMLIVSVSHSVVTIMAVGAVVLLLKGLMWPTVGSLIAANLCHTLHDKSFLVAALSSRVGDVLSSLILGAAMGCGVTWRHAVMILLVVVMTFFFISASVRPEDIAGPKDMEPSVSGQMQKWYRLFTCVDGWLSLFCLMGTYFGWALINYAAVIFQDVHSLDPGDSAAAAACFPVGMAVGLVTGTAASSLLGVNLGRVVHVVQVIIGIAAFATVSSWHSVPLHWMIFLLGVGGFGLAVPTYVPYLAYAASSTPSDRSFRLGTLDGFGCGWQILLIYVFGRMRHQGDAEVAFRLFAITGCGLTWACVSMALLYWRLGQRARQASAS